MDTDSAGLPADLRERLQATLGDAYTLERELGGGGMSRVFVAQDARLGRRVVVKVLHPDLAAGVSARRFEREIALSARLQHPHVVPVHASGDVDGLPYYTMPFVQGESLRERLQREGALPIADAARLVRELADALSYAHGEGVVHRDLKPENVLLSGGHAVVADFGVAKALATATQGGITSGASATATGLGLAVGTPAYMAPEQVAADPATDHRADLYALGLIAYEMVAGAHPFVGRSAQAMLAAQLTETPASLDTRRPDVPPALGALVARLLAKRPEDRPQSAHDVVRSLDTITTPAVGSTPRSIPSRRPRARLGAVVLAGMLVIGVAGALLWSRRAATTSAPGSASPPAATALVERRVAVSPFENQTADSALAPLGNLTSDWITQGLAEAAFAEVVDPQTVRSAWQTAANARALGAATGAQYVISGAYHIEGDSLRMLARITDAADGKLLRAVEPVSAPVANPRRAVAAMRERVLGALGVLLDVRVAPGVIITGLPPSLAGYRHWSAGMEHFYRNEFRQAIPELTSAARLDSTFLPPVLYLSISHMVLGGHREADSLLKLVARSRERIAPAERQMIDVWMAENRGDWAGAFRKARGSVQTAEGGTATANMPAAWNAARINRPRDALAALAGLDPERGQTREYAPYWEVLTQTRHQLGEYEAERAAAARGRVLHPDHVPVLYAEVRALAALGRIEDAERQLERASDLSPDPLHTPAEVMWAIGREFHAHGHAAAAERAFARALRWYDGRPAAEQASPALRSRRAEALYAAGRWDEARRLFEQLAAERPGEPSPVGDHGMYGLAPLGDVDFRGYLGALAARRGDRVTALKADSVLAAWPDSYLLGRHTFWRARIAALLGERDRAVALLSEALQQGRTHLLVHAEADFAPLHDLPAFQELVRAKP